MANRKFYQQIHNGYLVTWEIIAPNCHRIFHIEKIEGQKFVLINV